MKNFLLGLKNILLVLLINTVYMYVVLPVYFAGVMSWAWLPIVFDLNNCFGGAGLGFVLGIVISVGTEIIKQKVSEKLS